ncbi:MAG: hypothetical protein EOP61_33980 [Sphingomonadales bacterium]|nr:MAG: hypothetical protein EOP61_33980 [Sphingomonadales bacterium]
MRHFMTSLLIIGSACALLGCKKSAEPSNAANAATGPEAQTGVVERTGPAEQTGVVERSGPDEQTGVVERSAPEEK